MLWLAERHDTRKYVNKVVTSEDSLLCAKGQVYLIYPLPWLLRVGNIYKHVGLKFFSVSWHSKQEKSIWFEILFFNKNRLDYGVPLLRNFRCALTNHASTCKFQNIIFSIAENWTSLPYFPIPYITSLHMQGHPTKVCSKIWWMKTLFRQSRALLEMHSTRRPYKIFVSSVILGELKSFQNYKGFSIIFPKILGAM